MGECHWPTIALQSSRACPLPLQIQHLGVQEEELLEAWELWVAWEKANICNCLNVGLQGMLGLHRQPSGAR